MTQEPAPGRPDAAPPVRLLSPRYRWITTGLVLVVTLIAFEAMAVATAMPTAVAQLHGLRYYSWPFVAFMVASVVAMVVAGDLSDRRGPRPVLLAGLVVFASGLLLAGTATGMAVFVAGRAVQGLGVGLLIVPVFVVIAEVFDDANRPRVFAAVSAAWVVPALAGPAVSGILTEHLSWRWVFLGLLPLVVVGSLLVLPALLRLAPHRAEESAAAGAPRRGRGWYAVLAAAGLALVQFGGQHPQAAGLVAALAGAAMLVPAVRAILPPGTVTLRAGLPASIGYRGVLAGAFFGVEAFVPLALTQQHGFTATTAGLPLTAGALGWFAGSWFQGHRSDAPRHQLVRAGCLLVAVGALGQIAIAHQGMPGWSAVPAWLVGGVGMGLAIPSVSVLVMRLSPEPERGANSAALQVTDMLASATTIGVGGLVLVWLAPRSLALTVHDAAMAAVALLGAVLAGRLRVPPAPGERPTAGPASAVVGPGSAVVGPGSAVVEPASAVVEPPR